MPAPFASSDLLAPPWGMFLRDMAQVAHPGRFRARDADVTVNGRGRPVLVIPGFLASDGSTRMLRLALRRAGFRAHGWKRGRNLGPDGSMFDAIDDRVRTIADGQPVAVVGWSLGGLIAREYAKIAPDRVAQVITLGSPIAGDPRANNNVWRLYELVAGHRVDAPPFAGRLAEKPPVETIAIWSRRDGVIAPASACGGSADSDRQIEVGCGHIEFTFAPEAIAAVLDALG